MREFNFSKEYPTLLTPEIVSLVGKIHEYKGEQALFIEAKADTLTKLVEIAKIQSTEASNTVIPAPFPSLLRSRRWVPS